MEVPHHFSSWSLTSNLHVPAGAFAVLLSIFILCQLNQTASFYVKYSVYMISFFVCAIVSIPFMLLNPGSPKNIRIPRFFSRRVQAQFCGVQTKVKGIENYPNGPFVIVCNHQSILDCLAMMEVFPENCVVIMKKSLLYSGPFGLSALLNGAIFVDRNKNNSMNKMQKVAADIHRNKRRVWFFPEGTRKLSDNAEDPHMTSLLPFKKGAFNLAVMAQIPIIPVVFSSQDKFFNFREKVFTPGEITASILPPVPSTNLTLDDVPYLTEEVRAVMIKEFNKISTQT